MCQMIIVYNLGDGWTWTKLTQIQTNGIGHENGQNGHKNGQNLLNGYKNGPNRHQFTIRKYGNKSGQNGKEDKKNMKTKKTDINWQTK